MPAVAVVGLAYIAAPALLTTAGWIIVGGAALYYETKGMMPSIPEMSSSPTYRANNIYNTSEEDIVCARCYGKCLIGGNKLRFNDPDGTDTRIILGHCQGEVEGVVTYKVNGIAWDDLAGSHTKTEYTGTRVQTPDARFITKASAYRGIAYTAFTFDETDQQIGFDPHITVVMEGLKCDPLAGGAAVFTRNPAVILYDWLINVEGYSSGDLDTQEFQSLEELCDEVPTGGTLPRYSFDYNFDTDITINDAKKLIWQSFNGMTIMSQGKIKPVWDSGQMSDGAGSLTAKTVSHAFTENNIVKGSFKKSIPESYNVVRIQYKDSDNDYKNSSVEAKDKYDILINGEKVYQESCYFITDPELARRRAHLKLNKFKYTDYACQLDAFSDAGDLEVYDLVTVTHSKPGWTTKQFIVTSITENEAGQARFNLRAYHSGIYDDGETGVQDSYRSVLPNPYATPTANSAVSLSLSSSGTAFNYNAIVVDVTIPTTDPFYSYTEIYLSNDDATYILAGTTSGESFIYQGLGSLYTPGDTVYVRTINVNEKGVKSDTPGAAEDSIVVTGYIKVGSFYAGEYDFWGGNAAIDNAGTTIVLGGLDGTPKLALGGTADSMNLTNYDTYPGFYVDGTGSFRGGNATAYLQWNVGSGELTIEGAIIAATSDIAGTASDSFTINSDFDDVTTQLIFGRTTGGNATIGWDGTNISFDQPLQIGSKIITVPNPAIILGRDISSSSGNYHGFVDESTFAGDSSVAYNSYDAKPDIDVVSMDHYSGFQARPTITGSGTINRVSLHDSIVQDITEGATITNLYHFYVKQTPVYTDGTITNQYGLYIGSLLQAVNSWGLYILGSNMPNYIAGNLGIGTNDPDSQLEIESTGSALAHLDGTLSAALTIDRGATDQRGELRFATAGSNNMVLGMADSDNYGDGTDFFIGLNLSSPFIVIQADGDLLLSQDLYVNGGNISTASGNLTINPAGDLILNPTGDDVYPGAQDINLGILTSKWLTIHARELWVSTLVAEDVISTIGGHIITAPTTTLAEAVGIGDGSFDVVDASSFAVNDWIMLANSGKFEVMQITGIASDTLTVDRDEDGTGANTWADGDAVVNIGYAANEGWIEQYSLSSVSTGSTIGPTIVGNIRTNTTAWNDYVEGWAIGNLNGLYGYSSNVMGVGLGAYSEANYITIDPTNGIQFYDSDDNQLAQLTGTTWTLGDTSNDHIEITSGGIYLKEGAQERIVIANEGPYLGEMVIYDSGGADRLILSTDGVYVGDQTEGEYVNIDSTNGVRLYSASVLYTQLTNAGVLHLGNQSGEHVTINSTSFTLYDADGSTERVLITNDGALTLYDSAGADRLVLSTSGVYIGDQTEGDYIFIDSNSIDIYNDGSMYTQIVGGAITLGLSGGDEYIQISSSGINLVSGGETVFAIDDSGIGSISLLAGADITLTGDDADPAKIIWHGTSYDTEFYAHESGDYIALFPGTNEVTDFYIGGGASDQFKEINMYSNYFYFQSYYDSTHIAKFYLNTTSSNAYGQIRAYEGGTEQSYTFKQGSFSIAVDSQSTLGDSTHCWTNVYADAGVTSCSDIRWKTVIGQEPLGLDFINSLSFIEYELNKNGKKRKGHYRGLVGQELEQVLIECGYDPKDFAGLEINEDENGKEWYGINYEQLIPSLGRAIQQMSEQINDLKGQIKN